ncbi:MAG TPA: glycosyltransferase [Bacteroidales bacterium]|nr:glycosyltransferase [Thermoproteota archaeon]HOS16706.1 glycosyltransferase [Bacteroidales bacterium]
MKNNEIELALNDRFILQEEYFGCDKPVNHIVPLVSVSVATYQHEAYIKQCLDSILMQQTDFPIEIIIGEDGSVDGTKDICMSYAEKFPDKIRLFMRNRKLSQYITSNGKTIRFNGLWNRMSARGKYIAMCEGDDYWTDPAKLQKQVDFLEKHEDYSLCFHNAIVHWEGEPQRDTIYALIENRKYDGLEIQKRWIVPTASMVFKTDVVRSCAYNQRIVNEKYLYGDQLILFTAEELGSLYGMNEIMSVYRRNEGGEIYKYDIERDIKHVIHKLEMGNDFNNKYRFIVHRIAFERYFFIAFQYFIMKKIGLTLKYIFNAFTLNPFLFIFSPFLLLKIKMENCIYEKRLLKCYEKNYKK